MYVVLKKIQSSYSLSLYMAQILLGSFIVAISAQVSIPFCPVPMTLQPDIIVLISLFCRPSVALGIVSTYILEACLGLPVLQGFSGGVGKILGPTGGYISGFLLMSWIISSVSTKTQNISKKILACIIGKAGLYMCGLIALAQFVGFENVLAIGLYPFLPKTISTIMFALLILKLSQNMKPVKRNDNGFVS